MAKHKNYGSVILAKIIIFIGIFLFVDGLINLVSGNLDFWSPFKSWIFWGLIIIAVGKGIMHHTHFKK